MTHLPNTDFLNCSVKDPYFNVCFNPDLGKQGWRRMSCSITLSPTATTFTLSFRGNFIDTIMDVNFNTAEEQISSQHLLGSH